MPGILDMMGEMDPMMIQSLLQQAQAQSVNPMERPVAGSEYLQGLGQLPGPVGMSPEALQAMQGMGGTDFANVPPGLPNLPDSFGGFGYGQTAPKMNINQSQQLRQQLLQQLLGQAMGGGL